VTGALSRSKKALGFLSRLPTLAKVARSVDSLAPFSGPLGKSGYLESAVPTAVAGLARQPFDSFGDVLVLNDDANGFLAPVMKQIHPVVSSYLGSHAFLDTIQPIVIDAGYSSVSEGWHTDNVGARVKVFFCVEGDGGAPTLVVPSSDRIRTIPTLVRHAQREIPRYFGATNTRDLKGAIALQHSTGTLNFFDTDLLHRGAYEKLESVRKILLFEFSDRRKHGRIKGPLGTRVRNQFLLSAGLLEIPELSLLLDRDRLVMVRDDLFLYRQAL